MNHPTLEAFRSASRKGDVGELDFLALYTDPTQLPPEVSYKICEILEQWTLLACGNYFYQKVLAHLSEQQVERDAKAIGGHDDR